MFTPEDRERFYSEIGQPLHGADDREYELNDQQKTQVRSRLDEIKAQQKAYASSISRNSRRFAPRCGNRGKTAVTSGLRRTGTSSRRMHTLFEQSPLMNRDSVTAEVEKLLPAEQVEKGRARREAERQEWDRRREEMRRQCRNVGSSRAISPPADQNDRPPWSSRGGRDGERRDGDRRDASRGDGERRDGEQQGQEQQGQPEDQQVQPPLVENPIGPWDRYVRDFTRRYRFDESQRATAQSVLREMLDRRVAYEQSHREDFDAARQLELPDQQKRLAQLNQPVEHLFSQLKSRLERIPTTEQRRAAGDFASRRPPGRQHRVQPRQAQPRARRGRALKGCLSRSQSVEHLNAVDQRRGQMERVLHRQGDDVRDRVALAVEFLRPLAVRLDRVMAEAVVVDPLVPFEAPVLPADLVRQQRRVECLGVRPPELRSPGTARRPRCRPSASTARNRPPYSASQPTSRCRRMASTARSMTDESPVSRAI